MDKNETAPDVAPITADEFLQAYMVNLIKAKNKFPDLYTWVGTDVLEVFRRSATSFREGTYSRHSHAVKWTCKQLGLKNTREVIDDIFANQTNNEGEN